MKISTYREICVLIFASLFAGSVIPAVFLGLPLTPIFLLATLSLIFFGKRSMIENGIEFMRECLKVFQREPAKLEIAPESEAANASPSGKFKKS